MAAFIYPSVVAWVWGPGGWLMERNYHDLAGTGCIHLTGGVGGMIGAIIVGPRFLNKKGKANVDRQ